MSKVQVSLPLFVLALILAAALSLRPFSSPAPALAQAPQVAGGPYGISASDGLVYLIDTRSGRIWMAAVPLPDQGLRYRWSEINTPLRPKP